MTTEIKSGTRSAKSVQNWTVKKLRKQLTEAREELIDAGKYYDVATDRLRRKVQLLGSFIAHKGLLTDYADFISKTLKHDAADVAFKAILSITAIQEEKDGK